MEITKAIWDSWKKSEKRRDKDGTPRLFNKSTGQWDKVWWTR